jgi:hypothetical protein
MEQVFPTATVWTWDSSRGGKLRVVRLWLSMLRITPVTEKTSGIAVISLLLLLLLLLLVVVVVVVLVVLL